jgi:hypothetical protein
VTLESHGQKVSLVASGGSEIRAITACLPEREFPHEVTQQQPSDKFESA